MINRKLDNATLNKEMVLRQLAETNSIVNAYELTNNDVLDADWKIKVESAKMGIINVATLIDVYEEKIERLENANKDLKNRLDFLMDSYVARGHIIDRVKNDLAEESKSRKSESDKLSTIERKVEMIEENINLYRKSIVDKMVQSDFDTEKPIRVGYTEFQNIIDDCFEVCSDNDTEDEVMYPTTYEIRWNGIYCKLPFMAASYNGIKDAIDFIESEDGWNA